MTLPYVVAANEFLNFKGEKFSKSKGTGLEEVSMYASNSMFIFLNISRLILWNFSTIS